MKVTRAHLSRLDAGLNRLIAQARPGQCHSLHEIAAACGVSHQAMQQRQQRILEKIRNRFGVELKEWL